MSTSVPDEELLARSPLPEEVDGEKVVLETHRAESKHVALLAKRLCGVRHPHLVSVERVVAQSADAQTIVTERVDGMPLADVFYRLTVGARLRVVVDVLTALSALHILEDGEPIVHRGILLRSAFIERSGRTKLGFAWRAPLRVGTDGHAPEVLLGDEAAIGVHTDVYSAGVLLWEALTGRPLFGDADVPHILKRQLAGRLERALPPAADRWARSVLPVIDRSLAVDPKERYATVAEMAAALRIAVRARLVFHEDIVEEVWPADTVPKTSSGVQPVAEPTSEMRIVAAEPPKAESTEPNPSAEPPKAGRAHVHPSAEPPKAGPPTAVAEPRPVLESFRLRLAIFAGAAAVLIACVVVVVLVAARHQTVARAPAPTATLSAAPAVASPVIELTVEPPRASPIETATEPAQPQRERDLKPAPRAGRRDPAKPYVYQPSSI